ncbi:MAG: aminofutalosine synthase MqnE [Desulfobulbaceae bacterium]|nr:aminofutalosine synthase MqnE [Desulfofustis sp.]RZW24439.1 MAG: aminofutalosine synthase MqnE [Desulfobulbaceae bacterium]
MGVKKLIESAGLDDIQQKVLAGERLSLADGLRLYQSSDILAVGWLANLVRERLNGNKAYFIYNQHINYSNICTNLCKFCAFGRKQDDDFAYEMSIEEVKEKVRQRLDEPIVEIHMVGGIHPNLPFSYYTEVLRGIKEVRPEVHIQAFTCVEIAHLASLCEKSVGTTLEILREAGLDSMPGGGAEVFSSRIRERTCADKLPGEDWIEVAKTAHRHGFRTNATMLYGHIETYEERLEHLDALRQAQDETGGFLAFIPLAFHPKNTELSALSSTTGMDDLRNIAVARLMLDNFAHVKAYWVMIGPKLAQIALSFGADDLDGTVKEEVITHMAGAETDQAIGSETLIRMITESGRVPVERTTLYDVLEVHDSSQRVES